MTEYTGVAVLMMGITFVFFLFSVYGKSVFTQVIFGMITFLMIVADFFFARTIVYEIAPTETGFIDSLDTMYFIGVRLWIFVMVLVLGFILVAAIKFVKNSGQRKREERLEEFFGNR